LSRSADKARRLPYLFLGAFDAPKQKGDVLLDVTGDEVGQM